MEESRRVNIIKTHGVKDLIEIYFLYFISLRQKGNSEISKCPVRSLDRKSPLGQSLEALRWTEQKTDCRATVGGVRVVASAYHSELCPMSPSCNWEIEARESCKETICYPRRGRKSVGHERSKHQVVHTVVYPAVHVTAGLLSELQVEELNARSRPLSPRFPEEANVK